MRWAGHTCLDWDGWRAVQSRQARSKNVWPHQYLQVLNPNSRNPVENEARFYDVPTHWVFIRQALSIKCTLIYNVEHNAYIAQCIIYTRNNSEWSRNNRGQQFELEQTSIAIYSVDPDLLEWLTASPDAVRLVTLHPAPLRLHPGRFHLRAFVDGPVFQGQSEYDVVSMDEVLRTSYCVYIL